MSDYLKRSRRLSKSFIFILPLLVFYEMGILLYGSDTKNTADVIIKKPFEVFGNNATLVFNSLIIIIAFSSFFYIERNNRFRCGIFIPMFLESLAYAFSLGYVIMFFVHGYLPFNITNSYTQSIIICFGAGVYEEILFRLLLLSTLYLVFVKLLKINAITGSLCSILICACIFSIMHYTGKAGDTFTMSSFLFRLTAGIVLSAIFIFRGLGIAVYTHAIYDIFVIQNAYT